MIAILVFFAAHWYASIFAQSIFLHRYAAHSMFRMTPFWERFFYLFTFFAQGASFLNPRAYALLHMEHHKHSDTEEDPHSPYFFKDVISMMMHTKKVYLQIKNGNWDKDQEELEKHPSWPLVDRIGDSWFVTILFCLGYTAFYVAFAPHWAWFALLPVHFLIGPFQGAFVNWCGHKYGYSNYNNEDHSKNTFFWDLIFMGECFQNNHHRYPNRANFAKKWYEFDLGYPLIWLLEKARVIKLA